MSNDIIVLIVRGISFFLALISLFFYIYDIHKNGTLKCESKSGRECDIITREEKLGRIFGVLSVTVILFYYYLKLKFVYNHKTKSYEMILAIIQSMFFLLIFLFETYIFVINK